MADDAWLPTELWSAVGSVPIYVGGDGLLVETVREEARQAAAAHGGSLVSDPAEAGCWLVTADHVERSSGLRPLLATLGDHVPVGESYAIIRGERLIVVGGTDRGLLYGLFAALRRSSGESLQIGSPAKPDRMLDHWDNVVVHPVMGTVERGYAGDSLFFHDGAVRADLNRVGAYARLLAAVGINRIAINNVNVQTAAARLLTEGLADVARIADVLRPWGIRLHLSVSFAAPITVGGLTTADPLEPAVVDWWEQVTKGVYEAIPDFGGYLVKADSEGQPGPFTYGRDHADGANLLAAALAPYGGLVHWRAFVYDHHQDWRDRSTDRARAAYDHFVPLDGRFADNVVLQVKHGPMDFQVREPLSPLLAAMPRTKIAIELQVTQEYTGQQRHVCYLGPWWAQVMTFPLQPPSVVSDLVHGVVGVSNVGTDPHWTGHPLAQANLYACGRLAWDPAADPADLLQEWIELTFAAADPAVREVIASIMIDSWQTYESYTAPLGVGFMVRPGHHYGPDVDGYEYTPWGTYHFATRDGIGVDRTAATGTAFTRQYPSPWRETYESLTECPDELLLFFHHVPYDHRLRSGSTVVQHIYDTHIAGVERVAAMLAAWSELEGRIDAEVHARVAERLAEQSRSATEWRDQLCTYFWRKSGVPDARGRRLYP